MNNQSRYLRDIKTLRPWEKNPKILSKEGFVRLKNQIQRLGVYRPLVITEDGTVLGGNSRLRAFRELGYTEVWVSVVQAETEAKKLEYALSDNDMIGEVNEEELASLIVEEGVNIPLEDYKINLGSISMAKLLEKFGPDDESPEEATEEDKIEEGEHEVTCPECGNVFIP